MVDDLLASVEALRVSTLACLAGRKQSRLGQFFTPQRAAVLIAALPRLPDGDGPLRVLDPGAGSGMLLAALVARIAEEQPERHVCVTAVEIDEQVIPALEATVELCAEWASARGVNLRVEVRCEDLIYATTGLGSEGLDGFDLVIMNPPYAKLGADSGYRRALAGIGVDCPNLYAAFLAVGVRSLRSGGQLVAITPRSFANGPYFERFRRFLLDSIALDALHTFQSRSTVFSDTGVLQENVVLSGTKGGSRSKVRITSSHGHLDAATECVVDYCDLVRREDEHRFLRIPVSGGNASGVGAMLSMPCSLSDLGLSVSTGRVVDFRAVKNLRSNAEEGCAPLVYPGNLRHGQVEWPRAMRKAQAFAVLNEDDRRALVPTGCYVLVKRFSAKEERRRIVAALWDPEVNGRLDVAFENHLNVVHRSGGGLDRAVAQGLSLWLNSSLVDEYFRTFSGHTQVNATDLRTLRFPSLATLRALSHAAPRELPEQADLDRLIDHVTART